MPKAFARVNGDGDCVKDGGEEDEGPVILGEVRSLAGTGGGAADARKHKIRTPRMTAVTIGDGQKDHRGRTAGISDNWNMFVGWNKSIVWVHSHLTLRLP